MGNHSFLLPENGPVQNLFPERIRQLRIESNLTQKEIGYKLKMTRQGYSYYERGERRMTLSMMARLSDIYGVDIMEFIVLELSDFQIELTSSQIQGACCCYLPKPEIPVKPGNTLEEISKNEFLLLSYYRSLPAAIKKDIHLFLKNKRRIRNTGLKEPDRF